MNSTLRSVSDISIFPTITTHESRLRRQAIPSPATWIPNCTPRRRPSGRSAPAEALQRGRNQALGQQDHRGHEHQAKRQDPIVAEQVDEAALDPAYGDRAEERREQHLAAAERGP